MRDGGQTSSSIAEEAEDFMEKDSSAGRPVLMRSPVADVVVLSHAVGSSPL